MSGMDREAVERIGVRELRADLAALVRRAGAGERMVITVDDGEATEPGGAVVGEPGERRRDALGLKVIIQRRQAPPRRALARQLHHARCEHHPAHTT